jgi:hypothetical protein
MDCAFQKEKGGLKSEPAFFTGTVIANVRTAESIRGDSHPRLMNS